MHIYGRISQIKGHIDGETFINIDTDLNHVMAWTNMYQHPTFLLQNGNTIAFIQFEDESCAQEWIKEKKESWPIVRRIKRGGWREDN